MATASSERALTEEEPELEAEEKPEPDPWRGLGSVVKRDPEVKLQSPVSGLEPLSWSEDHRLSASSTSSISLLEIVCDVHGYGQDLVIHRTSIPVPERTCVLKVLIGHIFKKMNKQTFPEYCSLCKEVLPFTDRRQAVCSNGHMWLRHAKLSCSSATE
ncbi:UNVERIFIED_CONTAM: hypothetical protein FKN15_030325 [Acipenser sinensis]